MKKAHDPYTPDAGSTKEAGTPAAAPGRHRSRAARAGIAVARTAGVLAALCVLLLCLLTWIMTPERLTQLINEEASGTLKADVKVSNARFTFWSTFPRFCIEIDSMTVVSRTLRGLAPEVRRRLPSGADSLLATGAFRGGVNIPALLRGRILLRDVRVEHLNLNLVAVSDSLTNYDIWPGSDDDTSIPYFRADSVMLDYPGHLRYFSLASGADVDIDLTHTRLRRLVREGERYDLRMQGNVSAKVGKLRVLAGFPFGLSGRLDLRFHPFGIRTENYAVTLGDIRGEVDMDLEVGKSVSVNRFSYRLDNLSLDRLLRYFPSRTVPYLSRLNMDVVVDASARLTSAYDFSSTELPSVQVDFTIPDGDLSYTLSDNRTYSMRHTGASGHLVFDGENPGKSYFDIPEFRLEGEGAQLSVAARVTDLTTDPVVEAKVSGCAALGRTARCIPELAGARLRGRLDTDTRLRFRISDLRNGDFENLAVRGDVRLEKVGAALPGMRASVGSLDVRFGGSAGELTEEILANGLFGFSARGKNLCLSADGYTMRGDNLDIESRLSDNRAVRLADMLRSIPYDVTVRTAALAVENPKDTVSLHLRDVNLRGTVAMAPGRLAPRSLDLNLKGDAVEYAGARFSTSAEKVSLCLRADAPGHRTAVQDFVMPGMWTRDARFTDSIGHTPIFLHADLPVALRRIMDRWNVHADLRAASGCLLSRAFPTRNRFSDLNVSAGFDSLTLHRLDVSSESTAARLSASVTGLRRFLLSRTPAPLNVRFDMAVDTVQINQLAGAYERGVELTKGKEAAAMKPCPAAVSPSDTIALLIPRNLVADINVSAMQTRYMNLHLYDLGTSVSVRDGDVEVSDLRVSADFGHAALDFAYRTKDVERLAVELGAEISDVDVVRFFENFHTLLLMMPQMKNLSGTVAAECEGRMLLFPSMYVNVPSLWANLYLHGRGLTVHQNPFIRHITRMMLIRTSDNLHIANMDVHASVHDNLLELYPFDFEFDRYRLRMGGVNNFDGKLYYHIGVDKSPVPFPFGINIVGMFRHPELRFGGASYKVDKGSEITASVMEYNRLNLIRELKYYFSEFIHAAARSDSTAVHDYAF